MKEVIFASMTNRITNKGYSDKSKVVITTTIR